MDLIDIYRTFYSIRAGHTSLSSTHTTFSRIEHVRPQNILLFKKTEITATIFLTIVVGN